MNEEIHEDTSTHNDVKYPCINEYWFLLPNISLDVAAATLVSKSESMTKEW